jgi:predicted CoA-binding protein
MIDDPIHGSDETVERILTTSRTWAVVGCSPDPSRTSHSIAAFLLQQGYEVVPVHPGSTSILGRTCYPDLASIPDDVEIDVVDMFRRSEHVGPHVDEAIAVGASAVWMQLGVVDLAAAERARAAGLDVVMDRCPRIEIPRFAGSTER